MNRIWTTEKEAEKLAARFQGVNQAKFARDHAVPGGPSMVSQHIKGRRPLNLDAATAYARGFGVSLEEISPRLALEVSRAAPTMHPHEPAPEFAGTVSRLRNVPIVGTARMGDDGYYDEISSTPGAGDGHIEIATADPNAYGLRVRGSSMMPAIRDGWYVLVEPNGRPEVGEYVLIKLANGQRMVKELLYQRSDSIEIMSVNGEERRTIYNEEIEAIQAVAAVVSPSKYKPD